MMEQKQIFPKNEEQSPDILRTDEKIGKAIIRESRAKPVVNFEYLNKPSRNAQVKKKYASARVSAERNEPKNIGVFRTQKPSLGGRVSNLSHRTQKSQNSQKAQLPPRGVNLN